MIIIVGTHPDIYTARSFLLQELMLANGIDLLEQGLLAIVFEALPAPVELWGQAPAMQACRSFARSLGRVLLRNPVWYALD